MEFETKIVINLGAIQHNFKELCAYRPQSTLVPVIKNDAYGSGAVEVAAALEDAGATHLAVFSLDEALPLRRNGIKAQIWFLEGVLPSETELKKAKSLASNARFAIWNTEQIAAMEKYGASHRCRFKCHLKIDTAMSRLGFLPDEVPVALKFIAKCPHIELTGAFSHMAMGDKPGDSITKGQVAAFRNAVKLLPATCTELHLCATDAIVNKIAEELPFARPGIAIYGYGATKKSKLDLHPAMTFSSNVISVKTVPKGRTVSYGATYTVTKKTKLAVVPVGYADGYFRNFGNKAYVLIRGRRAPISGRVCMGMFMVDVTNIPDVTIGDEAVLLGRQGNEAITADKLAGFADTISYEILCSLGKMHKHEFKA